jgi:hypothetical protein
VQARAISTLRTLVNPWYWSVVDEDQIAQKNRVIDAGLISKLVQICQEGKETDAICESLYLISLLGSSPTALTKEHVALLAPLTLEIAWYVLLLLPCMITHEIYSRPSGTFDYRAKSDALDTLGQLLDVEALTGHVRSCNLTPKVLGLVETDEFPQYQTNRILHQIIEQHQIPLLLDVLCAKLASF